MKRISKTQTAMVAKAQRAELAAPVSGEAGSLVSRRKLVTVAGKQHELDHEALIRMVRQVTQTIGEYASQETTYAAYIANALRKARADMVSDLEHYFGVHWRIDEATGKSVFYL